MLAGSSVRRHVFRNKSLIHGVLIHRSSTLSGLLVSQKALPMLAWLGDSLLFIFFTEDLLKRYPHAGVDAWSQARRILCDRSSLARCKLSTRHSIARLTTYHRFQATLLNKCCRMCCGTATLTSREFPHTDPFFALAKDRPIHFCVLAADLDAKQSNNLRTSASPNNIKSSLLHRDGL